MAHNNINKYYNHRVLNVGFYLWVLSFLIFQPTLPLIAIGLLLLAMAMLIDEGYVPGLILLSISMAAIFPQSVSVVTAFITQLSPFYVTAVIPTIVTISWCALICYCVSENQNMCNSTMIGVAFFLLAIFIASAQVSILSPIANFALYLLSSISSTLIIPVIESFYLSSPFLNIANFLVPIANNLVAPIIYFTNMVTIPFFRSLIQNTIGLIISLLPKIIPIALVTLALIKMPTRTLLYALSFFNPWAYGNIIQGHNNGAQALNNGAQALNNHIAVRPNVQRYKVNYQRGYPRHNLTP